MDVIQRLQQLEKDITSATAEAKEAQEAWLSERDPQQEAKLEKVWQQLVKDKETLLAERNALSIQLTGTGVHTPLLAHNYLVSLPDGPILGTRVILPAAVVEGLLCVQAGIGAAGSAMKVVPPFLPSFNALIC